MPALWEAWYLGLLAPREEDCEAAGVISLRGEHSCYTARAGMGRVERKEGEGEVVSLVYKPKLRTQMHLEI